MNIPNNRLDFLNAAINHYNFNNRNCAYSKGCVIGRYLPNDLAIKLDSMDYDSSVGNNEVFNQLPKELQNLGQDFLERMQFLHDDPENWENWGLSENGDCAVEYIKKVFIL